MLYKLCIVPLKADLDRRYCRMQFQAGEVRACLSPSSEAFLFKAVLWNFKARAGCSLQHQHQSSGTQRKSHVLYNSRPQEHKMIHNEMHMCIHNILVKEQTARSNDDSSGLEMPRSCIQDGQAIVSACRNKVLLTLAVLRMRLQTRSPPFCVA